MSSPPPRFAFMPPAPAPARRLHMEAGPRPTLELETRLREEGFRHPAGIDEVGRGALAGPVLAAAVVLPPLGNCPDALEDLHDSKQLSPEDRCRLYDAIRDIALAWAVGAASPREIDDLGIARANELAMRRAVGGLGSVRPQHLMVDGLPLRWRAIPQTAVVRGDGKVLSIAAASVVAKVTRDALMIELGLCQPGYAFDANKGYGSAAHRRGVLLHGPSPVHRLSWALPGEVEDAIDAEADEQRTGGRPRFGRARSPDWALRRPGITGLRRLSADLGRWPSTLPGPVSVPTSNDPYALSQANDTHVLGQANETHASGQDHDG